MGGTGLFWGSHWATVRLMSSNRLWTCREREHTNTLLSKQRCRAMTDIGTMFRPCGSPSSTRKRPTWLKRRTIASPCIHSITGNALHHDHKTICIAHHIKSHTLLAPRTYVDKWALQLQKQLQHEVKQHEPPNWSLSVCLPYLS